MKYYLGLFLCCYSFYLIANETPDGDKLFQKHCSECHQKDGNSIDENIPRIAQFSAILTYDILDQFKSGDRKAQKVQNNYGQNTDMNLISKSLLSDEIEAISHYIASQSSKPATQIFDKKLATEGQALHMDLCENCHVDGGTNPIEDTPILRGQWKPYLITQFEALSKLERDMPKRMKKRFRKLSENDKKALIEFYVSPVPTD